MTLRALWPVTQQFQNKNGSNLVSGKVYIYYQGRTALATTYHDEEGTVVNSNPVLLDNNGRATVFVNTIYSYTIVVCDYYGKELFSQDITIHYDSSAAKAVVVLGTDGTVLVDRTELPNGVQYDLSVNTDIIATKKSVVDVNTEINNEVNARQEQYNEIVAAIPRNTSELDNDSGYITANDVTRWVNIPLTNTELNSGDSYLSINPSLRLFKCQITYRTLNNLNKGGWYTMCTFEPITTEIAAIQCSMDLDNDHNRYILGRVNLLEGKLELYAYDGAINSGRYVNVVGCPVIFSNY